MNNPEISILVRSHNDEQFIGTTLERLLAQTDTPEFEIVVCDDGSTDKTPEIIARYPQIRQISRPVGRYFPGRTLNAMINQAKGRIIVFNNADAVPQNQHFLKELTAPLLSGETEIVYANQLPRPDAQLLVQKDNNRAFGDGKIASTWNFFFSLASSGVNGELVRRFPFDENITYSEDVEWAYRMKKEIRYVPQAIVEHSHNYSLPELARRFYGEGYADGQIFHKHCCIFRQFLSMAVETLRDWKFLWQTPDGNKEWWNAPRRRFIQKYQYWRGCRDYFRRNPHA